MRVLFITRKYPPQKGGMEAFSEGLFEHLKTKKGIIALTKNQIHLIWFYPFALFKTLSKAKHYDIIHLGDGVLGLMGAILKKLTNTKVSVTVHGLDLLYKKPIHQLFNVKSLQKFDHIIAVSNFTKEICIQKGIAEENITVIPNGINPDHAKPHFPKLKPHIENIIKKPTKNLNIITTVGRLVERKGVLWFLENVFPTLPENTVYLIVGNGPQKEEIQNKIKELKNVYLLSHISHTIKEAILKESDLFITPNITVKDNAEGFGIVAIEAASKGTPVIASNIEGLQDAVTGQTGVKIAEKDAESFSKTITELLENKQELEKLSRSAWDIANKRFAWKTVAETYLKTFKEILDDN